MDGPDQRGHSQIRLRTVRLDSFSDCVFAFAITLLVFDITVPSGSSSLGRDLLAEWPVFMAYIVSFVTIGALWLAHVAVTDSLTSSNAVLMRINLALLLVVSFLPFPTRLLAHYLRDVDGVRLAVTAYGINLLLATTLVWVLWRYARQAGLVDLTRGDDDVAMLGRRLRPGLVAYVLVIVVGLVLPRLAMVGYLAVGFFLLAPAARRLHRYAADSDAG